MALPIAHKLTTENKQAMYLGYSDGKTVNELARQFNVTAGAIYYHLTRASLRKKKFRRRHNGFTTRAVPIKTISSSPTIEDSPKLPIKIMAIQPVAIEGKLHQVIIFSDYKVIVFTP